MLRIRVELCAVRNCLSIRLFPIRWEDARKTEQILRCRICGIYAVSTKRKTKMKSSSQDKAEGSAKDLKGKVKEGIGKATGDKSLRAEGEADQAAGKTQKKVGDVKKVFGK